MGDAYVNLDEEDILERLNKLGIPVAEEYLPDSVKKPYVILSAPSADYGGADGYNYYRDQRFVIELYLSGKKSPLRKKLFNLFRDIPFHVEEESGGLNNFYLVQIQFISKLFDLDNENDDE